MKSAYVLELYGATANNSGDLMGSAWVVPDVASLRRCLEGFTEPGEQQFLLTAAFGTAQEGGPFVLRVWTVQLGVAGEPIDVRRFVRVSLDEQSHRLDELEGAFEEGSFPSDDAHVEVLWDAIESRLEPLRAPVLGPDDALEVELTSDVEVWFAGALRLGENVIEP